MSDTDSDVKNNPAEPQEPAAADPSAVEDKAPEVTDDVDSMWDDDSEEDTPAGKPKAEPSNEEPAPNPKEGTEAKPEGQAEDGAPSENKDGEEPDKKPGEETPADEQLRGKMDANSRIGQLVKQNHELKQEIAKLTAQHYAPKTAEQLVEEGMTEDEAKVESQRQSNVIEKFNTDVAELNTSLELESQQVLEDFPMFDPGTKEKPNPDYDAEFAEEVQALYMQAAQIKRDSKTGLIVSANILPYDFYKSHAKAYQRGNAAGKTAGQVEGQRSAERQLAAVDATPSASPKTAKKDPLDELWDADD